MARREHVRVERDGGTVTITMSRPERRNALSLAHLSELREAVAEVADGDATGIVLAGDGPVFCAGHDISELVGADLESVRSLLWTCTALMEDLQRAPQVVCARVHGLATAAGCQLVATCDLAVAAESASFCTPGGRGGWFCTTPMVAVGRSVARKHAMEMALTGDPVDARTALAWGLVNRVVPDSDLDAAVHDLLARATRGAAGSRALGKRAMYTQLGLDQSQAYAYAVEVMASASQTPEAQEWAGSFVGRRRDGGSS